MRVIYERDPVAAARLEGRQNAAIMETVAWVYEPSDRLAAETGYRAEL